MTGDVFKEDPSGSDLADDAGDFGPQVPFVVFALALSGGGKWLAWIAREDRVDVSAPRSAVEGANIIPDRGGGEISGSLRGDEGLSGIVFPFDMASRVESGLSEHEAHVEATAAGTQGQSVFGT